MSSFLGVSMCAMLIEVLQVVPSQLLLIYVCFDYLSMILDDVLVSVLSAIDFMPGSTIC